LPRGAGFTGALDAYLRKEYPQTNELRFDPCDGTPRK